MTIYGFGHSRSAVGGRLVSGAFAFVSNANAGTGRFTRVAVSDEIATADGTVLLRANFWGDFADSLEVATAIARSKIAVLIGVAREPPDSGTDLNFCAPVIVIVSTGIGGPVVRDSRVIVAAVTLGQSAADNEHGSD